MLEDHHNTEHGLEIGRGGFWLKLNEDQFAALWCMAVFAFLIHDGHPYSGWAAFGGGMLAIVKSYFKDLKARP